MQNNETQIFKKVHEQTIGDLYDKCMQYELEILTIHDHVYYKT